MMRRMKNPKFQFGFWGAMGIALGISFGININSLTVGLPLGLCVSYLIGIVADRTYRKVSRNY